jgi:predicted  nucleic acid-binding Zn-ribbon protein
MPETTKVQPMDSIQKEIAEIKAEQKLMNTRIYQVERITDKHDNQINSLTEKLSKIEDNTTWIKRAIIGGIITITCSVVTAISIAAINGVFQNIFSK